MTQLLATLAIFTAVVSPVEPPVESNATPPVEPPTEVKSDPGTAPNEIPTEVHIDQATNMVSIASRGADVRNVLFDLFEQAEKSFVLEPNTRYVLFLALNGVEFDEALAIVCNLASLEIEVQNGIYYIGKKPATGNPAAPVTPPVFRVTEEELNKKVTVKMERADIRAVFREFSTQTGVIIDIDPRVPAYKLDTFLIGTTLKFAIETVTKAADLQFVLTDSKTILIKPKS
ncbi:MAG: hypothetical protein KF812_09085 [Fimbriimonadaceae bacterium]|nr:hypothetical protein [Fimbriimonadaceae bacterium]